MPQLADVITASVTPDFKVKCRRAAEKHRQSLAAYTRQALSDRLTADGVKHKRPDGGAAAMERRP